MGRGAWAEGAWAEACYTLANKSVSFAVGAVGGTYKKQCGAGSCGNQGSGVAVRQPQVTVRHGGKRKGARISVLE